MDARRTNEWRASRITTSRGVPDSVHQLAVDHSERHSALLDAVHRSGWFDVRMDRLATGDYLVNGEVLVERKTIRDLVASLVDGRLFSQVARLAHSPCRSLLLIEDPTPSSLPDVHHHSVEGALVSIAAIWRVPVLHSSDSEQSARMLRFLADQVRGRHERVLRRFDPKPKRLASRRLFLRKRFQGSDLPLRTGSLPLRFDRTYCHCRRHHAGRGAGHRSTEGRANPRTCWGSTDDLSV